MKSNDFKDRYKYKAGTLNTFKPKCSIEIFDIQYEYMRAYLATRKERAIIEDIKL